MALSSPLLNPISTLMENVFAWNTKGNSLKRALSAVGQRFFIRPMSLLCSFFMWISALSLPELRPHDKQTYYFYQNLIS